MKKKNTIKKMFKKISSKKIFLLVASFFLFVTVLTTFLKTYGEFVSTLNRENSGINGTTVYVNDAESDWYYYTSMNYAYNPVGSDIPTAVDKNIYNRNNLVEINITYNGTDPVSNLTGKVSTTENQDKFVYYKVLPVDNNGTSGNTSDDYVLVELIDNPFALRPNDYGFNGWITTYRGVSIYLDTTYYVRYAKVPVTYTNSVPNSIDITFYAKWLNSKRARMSTSSTMSTVYQDLDSDGFYLMGSYTEVYEDCTNLVLYTRGSVSGNWWWGASYPSGAVNAQGQSLSGQTCTSSTCYYYLRHNGACASGTTYYKLVNNNMQVYTPQLINTITDPGVPANSNIAGYYKQVTVSRNAAVTDVYNADGSYVASTTCNTSGGCTYYRLQGYYNASNEENLSDGTRSLYYKATRDTNIIFFDTSRTSVGTVAKPATFTGIYEGTLHTNTLTISGSGNAVSAAADMRIEYIRIDSGTTRTTTDQVVTGNNPRRFIFANFHNLKIGRGITQNGSNVNAHSITGAANSTSTQGSASSPKRFRLIVESGLYNFASCSMGSLNSNGTRPTIYQVGELIVGNDYDRVKTNGNNSLEVYENLNGTFGGNYTEASTHEPLFNVTVKSGQIGASHDDYSTGIYVGGRGYSSDKIGGTMKLKVEGGSIYNIIGGPLVTSSYENRNVVDLSMTGGTVEAIFGGAGDAATYGNRIIKVIGGKVNYSVLGGSNGYQSEEGAGKVNGTTYVYVGGTATIGDMTHVSNPNDKFYGFEAGSVFGIGNGKTGSSTVGSCDSSNVIINDHATINKNVYGGGNWGATGVVATENTNTTNIVVAGGEIKGSVYGAGNNNGSGSDTKTSTITINVLGGTIDNNVYGGSKALGRVYGNVNVNVDGGTITNVYGGGEGGFDDDDAYGTFVSGNVNVKIGDTSKSTSPTITKVYGGSAFGTVNGAANSNNVSSTHTKVTVNKGNILDVFGGGEGNDTYTPRVLGNAETIINGGTVTNVYGANDAKGKPNGTLKVTINGGNVENVFGGGNLADITNSEVRLKGGTVGSAFGGGNEAAATNTYVYLEGSSCTSIYGGSNVTGNVTTSHITATSGSSTNVYGGNNQGGVTSTSNITVSGASITNVFGGGNLATTGTTHVTLSSGTVNNVYGGGNQAGITTSTEVLQNGVTNQVIFGGSNVSGNVPVSNITINGGSSTDVYGGNNQGGVTTTANITGTNGTVGNMYGGGNLATTGNTVISITGTNVSTLFGGGNRAGVNVDTSVTISGGTVSTVFGGSNMSGVVPESHVTLSGGTASTVFGGNNQGGSTTTTNVTTMGSSITQVFGCGNEADCTTTNVKIAVTNGTITNVFGGGNKATVTTTNVELRNGVNVTNVYGGSNTSGIVTTSHVNIPYTSQAPTISSIYGGNNQGGKTSSAHIVMSGGTVNNVYGGGNYAVTDNASTTISGGQVLAHVYGGGNQAAVNYNTTLSLNNTSVGEYAFGGGNLGIVGGNTLVNVNNTSIGGSLFAGGNGSTAAVLGNTSLNVGGTTTVTNHIFGGGNAAPTGTSESNNSTSMVNIVGVTCGGNVYGGANTSVLHGTTTVNIGVNAINTTGLNSGNISIGGTVFGGGEANESGSEIYDFSFISVTTGININIDASGHSVFNIGGSIFGSGNASSTSGYSYVTISNYGTEANYKTNISIQRATKVSIMNSAILLTGATDRTNEYSDVLFSLSRINELQLLNNSVLYLENSTNLVKKFTSGIFANNNITKASVTFDNNGNATRNVNNKIYIYEGRNINIATNENITSYGEVTGMTFFGMFVYDRNNHVDVGYFKNNYNNNSIVDGNELTLFTKGSYVLGAHVTNHNFEIDGFYSNFPDKNDTDKLKVNYINPTPDDANYYMWVVGEAVTSYEVTLTASKYSTLGAVELPLINNYQPNTIFSIRGFNYNEVASGVNLVDKNSIPRVAASNTIADNNMSLVMTTTDYGWMNTGRTTFLTNESYFTGTTNYLSENSSDVPTLLFYLYHSKNLGSSGDMGTATISLVAIVPVDDLNNEVKRINIVVHMNRALFNTDDYEGTIATGKKYEMFPPSSNVHITSNSSFSAYYSLFVEKNETIYRPGYHRVLASTYNLPVNTKITMIDYRTSGLPDYYYYIVTANDYTEKANEISVKGDASYQLSKFIKMGSSVAANHYDDADRNNHYYDDTLHIAEEEFIFIVDFKEANVQEDAIQKSLIIELRDSNEEVMMSVIGVEQQQLFYNLYRNKDSVIDLNATLSTNEFYIGHEVGLNVQTNYVQQRVGNNVVVNTNFYDYKSGIKITILDNEDKKVTGPSIMGISYTLGTETYYPRFDGTVRINTSERIANINDNIIINTEGSNLASGNYKLYIESFGSPDGIYYGLTSSDQETIPFTVKNTIYGLKVTQTSNDQLIVNKDTGKNETNTNAIGLNIEYSSGLLNPNIRIALYRRKYNEVYSTSYELVDFKDTFTNEFATTNASKIYMLFNEPTANMNTTLYLKDNLTTGTYRIVVSLYDNNTFIGDVHKYIIIK